MTHLLLSYRRIVIMPLTTIVFVDAPVVSISSKSLSLTSFSAVGIAESKSPAADEPWAIVTTPPVTATVLILAVNTAGAVAIAPLRMVSILTILPASGTGM